MKKNKQNLAELQALPKHVKLDKETKGVCIYKMWKKRGYVSN